MEFVLDRRPTQSQRSSTQMHRQTPCTQGTVDNMTQQLQGMQLYHLSEQLHQQTQGKSIQENLDCLGQYTDHGAINHQKLNHELNNLEQAYKDLREKLDTARALFTYQAMLPGPIVTMDTLQGIPKGTDTISKMNLWTVLTLHMNSIAQEFKRSRVLKHMESQLTLHKLTNQGKQLDTYLCIFRLFLQEISLAPILDSAQFKHFENFMAALTDHVKKMIFTPGEVLTLAVLMGHARNCTRYSVVRRMLVVLHLALNIKVRGSNSIPNKAANIIEYLKIGDNTSETSLENEVREIIAHHYHFACDCKFHCDLNIPPNWLEFEKFGPNWKELETEIKAKKTSQRLDTIYVPEVEIREELQYKVQILLQRQLTNSFVVSQPMTRDEQELYCKANHMTYSRDHMIVFLIRLMDHFPRESLEFLHHKLHKMEVAIMQLCPCTHHVKFREMTQYNSNSILGWAHMLKANRRMEDTPLRIRLGGPRKQYLLPQLWDCESSSKNIGMYIPDRIKEATKGVLVMNLLQGKPEPQIEVAKLYWAINEYTEIRTRQGNSQLGQIWMSSASYRTFVHIFRSRPRGPIYGVPMSPMVHPSQVMPIPSIPTMANLPAYAAVTPPVVTPPKRPRFLPPSEASPVGQNATKLEFRLVDMSHTSVTYQHNLPISNSVRESLGKVSLTKRKIEEQVKTPSNPYPQQIVKPKVPQQPSMRMERPIQPKPSEQKYFPPGPQKVIRTPVHILKREVFAPPPRSAREKGSSENPIKELAKLQEKQTKPTSSVTRNKSDTQEKPLDEIKSKTDRDVSQNEGLPVVQEEKGDEAVSSDNLDLEEIMEGIQEGSASSIESTKSE